MTRSVRIQESGVSQDFSDVKTVTTPVVGGGNATWMPEDETAVGEITITGNGEYVPSEHNLYGFYKVNVIVPGGGQGEYVSPGGIGVNIDGTIPMTQPDGTISNVRIGDGPYIPPPAGMGGTIDGVSVSGGTIAGIDPNTGEYVQYTVIDSNGVPTLSMTTPQSEPRPASIGIINPPSQTTYAPGELIKYSGLQVGVYDQNGNQFTAPAFTVDGHTYGPYDGTIPFSELSFPVKYAPERSYTRDIYTNTNTSISHDEHTVNGPVEWVNADIIDVKNFAGRLSKAACASTSSRGGTLAAWFSSSVPDELRCTCVGDSLLFVSNESFKFGTLYAYEAGVVPSESHSIYGGYASSIATNSYDGCYYVLMRTDGLIGTPYCESNEQQGDIKHLAHYIMFGDDFVEKSSNSIPVEWTSPYDNIAYGDHFSISISNDGYSGSGGGSF